MIQDESPYSPPARSPEPESPQSSEGNLDQDGDRLPPPVFSPGINRRPVHRAAHLPPPASSLPSNVVYGPDDDPPRRRPDQGEARSAPTPREARPQQDSAPAHAREARSRDLASLLERLAEELRSSGTLRFVPARGSGSVEAALRGFLSGVLISSAREDPEPPAGGAAS